jgi:hypothetical protein
MTQWAEVAVVAVEAVVAVVTVAAVAAVAALGVGHKVTRLEALIKTMMTAMGHLRVSAHMGYGYLYIHKKGLHANISMIGFIYNSCIAELYDKL